MEIRDERPEACTGERARYRAGKANRSVDRGAMIRIRIEHVLTNRIILTNKSKVFLTIIHKDSICTVQS